MHKWISMTIMAISLHSITVLLTLIKTLSVTLSLTVGLVVVLKGITYMFIVNIHMGSDCPHLS